MIIKHLTQSNSIKRILLLFFLFEIFFGQYVYNQSNDCIVDFDITDQTVSYTVQNSATITVDGETFSADMGWYDIEPPDNQGVYAKATQRSLHKVFYTSKNSISFNIDNLASGSMTIKDFIPYGYLGMGPRTFTLPLAPLDDIVWTEYYEYSCPITPVIRTINIYNNKYNHKGNDVSNNDDVIIEYHNDKYINPPHYPATGDLYIWPTDGSVSASKISYVQSASANQVTIPYNNIVTWLNTNNLWGKEIRAQFTSTCPNIDGSASVISSSFAPFKYLKVLQGTTYGTQPTCNNGADGTLNINFTSGVPTSTLFLVSISGSGPPQSLNLTFSGNPFTIPDQSPGTYQVKLDPINDSYPFYTSTFSDINVGNPPVPSANIQYSLNPSGSYHARSCDSNGSLILTGIQNATALIDIVNGGTTYTNGGTNSFALPKTASGMVTLVQRNGCDVSGTLSNLNFNTTPAINFSLDRTNSKNVSCVGNSDGEIHYIYSGGYGAQSINIDGTNRTIVDIGSNQYKVNSMAAGMHNVYVTDAANCTKPDNINTPETITISQPTLALQGSNNPVGQPLCFGGDGSVTLIATNGWGSYQYKETGGTYQSNPTIGFLKNGTHNFSIIDAGGCEVNVNGIPIIDPSAITIASHDPLPASCSTAKNGQIIIDFGGGTGNKTYSVTGTSYSYTGSYTSGTSITLNNLPVGTFTVSVTDANYCSTSANFSIAGATNTLHISDFNVSQGATCNQIADGIAYININGGDRPAKDYLLLTKNGWRTLSSGSDTAIARWLSAGTNTITIKDAGGCVYSNQYSMPLKSSHFQIAHVPYETACKQLSTGKVSVLRQTGTGASGEIQFSLLDSTKKNNDGVYFYKLPVGSYLVKAIDSQGCRDSVDAVINISSSALKITNSVVRNAACTTSPTGIIKVQRNNGTGIGNTSFYLLDSVKPNVDNTNFYGLPIGNYYVKAIDNIGCRDSVNFDIVVSNNTLQINSSYVFNDAACSTSPTGTIVATCKDNGNKSGWGLVKFKIGANEVSARDTVIYSKLLPGSYTITAEDSVQCSATKTLVVKALPNSVYFKTPVITSQSCTEVLNGSIAIGAITGSNIKKFVYKNISSGTTSDWQEDVTYSNLKESTYQIRVVDTNRCSRDTFVYVGNYKNNPQLKIASFDSIACAEDKKGIIRFNVKQNMRKPPFRFYLNGKINNSDSIFYNRSSKKDTILVMDNAGCPGDTILQAPMIANSIKFYPAPFFSNTSCVNAQNGTIRVSAINGVPDNAGNYKFKINTGDSIVGTIVTFDSLEANRDYVITVTDVKNCSRISDVIPIRVIDNILKLDSVVPQSTACSEMAAGSVKFKRLYGNPFQGGFKFILKDFKGQKIDSTMTVDSVIPFKNLYKGRYSVTVNDTNKCSASQSFYVDSVPLFSVNGIIPIRVSKYGTNNGEIRTSVNDGNKQFEYELYQLRNPLPGTTVSEGTVSNTILINNLFADNYLLKIRDIDNCIVDKVTGNIWFEDTVTVVQPAAALSLSIAKKTNVACYGENTGNVTLTATGGWEGYKYAINNKTNFVSNAVFTDLKKGTYAVFVQDVANVNDSLIVSIDQPADTLSSMATTLTNKCFGDLTGSIQVETLGGTSPYDISIDSTHWISNTDIKNLPAGTYNVVVRDVLNCLFRVKNMVVNQPAPISVKNYTIMNTPCLKNEGSVSVISVKGGNGNDYKYEWFKGNNALGTQSGISNLYSGSYHLSLTDMNGCKGDTAFFVSDLSNIWVNFAPTAVNCWGQANGSATMTVVNGALPLQDVKWPGKQLSFYATTDLDSGLHHVTIIDGLGCQKDTTFNIATISEITIPEVWPYRPLCLGRDDGSLQVSASGGRGGYAYDWGKYGSGDKITGLAPGIYDVTVTDANNCSKPFNFSLNYDKVEKPDLGKDLLLCSMSDYLLDPKGYLKYQWTVNNKMVSTDPIMVVKEPGTYVVNVESDEGCLGADTVNMSFSADQLAADFLLTTKANAGDTIMLVEISKPLPDSVVWILAPGAKLIDQGMYFKEIALPDTGTYEFSLIAYSRGCADMVKKYVQVVNQGEDSNLKSGVADLIQSVKLYPNPNSGEFSADILLSRKADVLMRIVNVGNGSTEYMNVAKGSEFYTERFSLHLTPGVYLLYIQAGGESRTVNIVVR